MIKIGEKSKYPKDWKVLKIEDVAEVKGGKRLPKGYTLQEEPNGYPYITVSDMYFGGISTDKIKYIPEEVVSKLKNYRISKDDLFISVAGTLGIVGKVPEELHNANLTENADKLTNIKIDKEYLYQVLISDIIQKEIEKVKTTNAQPKLALTRIKTFTIPVPPTEEISKIASILSTWDKAIQLKQKLLEQLKMQKKGLMQKLLTGKVRLPGFKEEWTTIKLGQYIKLQGGFAFKSSKFKENGIPIIRISNIVPEITDSDQDFVYYDKVDLADNFKVYFGDILIAMSGATTGKVGIYKGKEIAYLNQRVGKFINLDYKKLDDQFLYYLIGSNSFKLQLKEQLATGAQPNISSKQIEDFKFKIPSLDEQQLISKILNEIDKLIFLYEKEITSLMEQKQGLMQLLLTGKIRVRV